MTWSGDELVRLSHPDVKRRLAEIRRTAGRHPAPRPLTLVQQVALVRWELGIARRDAKANATMRRNAERRAAQAERHLVRLERRLHRVIQATREERRLRDRGTSPIEKPVPAPRRNGRRPTWLQQALETTALPAHQWEALRPGGFIR